MLLEPLEDRVVPSGFDDLLSAVLAFPVFGPITSLHYSPAYNFAAGSYNAPEDPGSAGFNLVQVETPQQLTLVPNGCKALVSVNMVGGADNSFINFIKPFIGNPKVYGFYLADEPNPATVPASNLKAESDWIHDNFPGAKTFIVLYNNYQGYTPANTDIDYVGLDPYPIRTWGINFGYIPYAVFATELLGWSRDQIVPVYQTFGDAGTFVMPNVQEEQAILTLWGVLTPTPPFDYAYSWGEWGSKSLVDSSGLQSLFLQHNTNPPLNPIVLYEYATERMESNLFTLLASVQPTFTQMAKNASDAVDNNPYHNTAIGNNIDQLLNI